MSAIIDLAPPVAVMRTTWRSVSAFALVAGWLAMLPLACGRDSPATPTGPHTLVVSVSISMSPADSGALVVGRTRQLSALATLADGQMTACTDAAVWRTSDATLATVSAGGLLAALAPGVVEVSAICSGVGGTASVTVWAAASLTGTVTADGGSPLEGATIWVPTGKYGTTTQTDAAGRYHVSGIARGSTYQVYASKAGYESASASLLLSGPETTLDFTLRLGFSVGGRTTETGVGPLGGVTVTVAAGRNAGMSTESTSWGAYTLQHLLPGEFTLRASKPGYDPVERTVTASVDTTVDFAMKASYGSCLVSVDPLVLDRFPSAGGGASIAVNASSGRTWTAVASAPWLEVSGGGGASGPGTVGLAVRRFEPGATDVRTGTVRVGCGPSEGQDISVHQLPDCQTMVAWAPGSLTLFPASGGTGHLIVRTGIPGCHWQAWSRDGWLATVGVNDWYGDFEAHVVVQPNATGARRVGTVVIGEVAWTITQEGA